MLTSNAKLLLYPCLNCPDWMLGWSKMWLCSVEDKVSWNVSQGQGRKQVTLRSDLKGAYEWTACWGVVSLQGVMKQPRANSSPRPFYPQAWRHKERKQFLKPGEVCVLGTVILTEEMQPYQPTSRQRGRRVSTPPPRAALPPWAEPRK